jgi:hypothetical protein
VAQFDCAVSPQISATTPQMPNPNSFGRVLTIVRDRASGSASLVGTNTGRDA